MYSSRQALALGLSALLLVAGCNGDSDASDEPTETFSPTASSTPTESKSTYTPPEPAKPPKGGWPEDKPATEIPASSVARAWADAYGEAMTTGDTRRMRSISGPSCAQCHDFADDLDGLYAAGGGVEMRSTPYKVLEVEFVRAAGPTAVILEMRIRVSAGTRHPGGGAEPIDFDAATERWTMIMAVRNDHWRVKTMGLA